MLIDWEASPRAPGMREGAVRRVVTGDRMSVVRVRTEPTAQFDGQCHRHDNEQWLVVLGGAMRFACADQRLDLAAGDVVHIPSRAWHGVLGVGATGADYLEFSAPPRLDLLPGSVAASPMEFGPLSATGP